LRQNLSPDGRAPEWPKVVISNLQIPADQMTLTRSLTLKASDCIRFDAVLWHDAKRSERFSNLSLCAPELPKQSNNFVLTAYSTPIPPPIPVQTLPAIPDETRHPLHSKPYRPFQSKVGHPFQNKPATQAG